MAYKGQAINIPLGEMGLYTDDSQTITPPQGLLMGENIEIKNGFIEKSPGSRKWNLNPLPNLIISQIFDWWPDSVTQRMIAVTKDGRVWRFTDAYNFSEITPVSPAPANLKITGPVVITPGGQEVAGRPRKLFIFTGNDPVQVISGDGTTRTNIELPALDWTLTNQPSFGIVFNGRLWAFGNHNQPHLLYASSPDNHEDFQTLGSAIFVNVFPGDNQGLLSAYNYKGRLLLFKFPFGFYYIDTTDPTAPIPQKLADSFGPGAALSTIQVIDNLWVGNSSGTITSLAATNSLGGLQQDDVIKSLKCYRYITDNVALRKGGDQQAMWYEAKKLAMFTYHSPSGANIDRIFIIDFQSGKPRASLSTKDQPNCLALVKDVLLIQRPFYGSSDGYIYQMDTADRVVGGNGENNKGGHAYTMNFQIPYLDFSFVNRQYSEMTKNFDFLEITFEPTGNWSLTADVYIDNNFVETIQFQVSQSDVLDTTFVLDKSRLSGPGLRSQRKPLHGQGRRISVRFHNAGLNQNVRISAMTFYFRLSGQQQMGA